MKRALLKQLLKWKDSEFPMPIMIRGARQVGKSYLVEQFGKGYFDNTVIVNFEFEPQLKHCFETLDPKKITTMLTALTGKAIEPQKTLLFLDEIQECPSAILSLRYFKEKMPNLHVISAGSLLEFVLNDADFRMPVGRVQHLFLKPLSFKEFLLNSENALILKYIQEASLKNPIPQIIHYKLLTLVQEYIAYGGMPAVLEKKFAQKNITECQNIQSMLLNTYRNDFGKYAKKTDHKYLQELFEKVPGLIANNFKYSSVSKEMKSRDLKKSLELLISAGIIHKEVSTTGSGLPFATHARDKKFKLFFLDVGLINRALKIDAEILVKNEILLINRGSIAEQFVAQELLAYANPYEQENLYYWSKEKKNSNAEIDFLLNIGGKIVPVEVKAGHVGRLRSLKIFMEEKKLNVGIKISQEELGYTNNVLSVPLYMIDEITRLVKNII